MIHQTIKKLVEDYYTLKIDSKTRKREYIEARAIYYKLLRDNSRMSLSAIGKTMNKDHATVLYTINKIDDWVQYDKQLRQDYETLTSRLKHAMMLNPEQFKESINIEGFYEIEYKKLEEKHTYIVNKSVAKALAKEAKKYDILLNKYNFLKSRLEKYEPKRVNSTEFDLV